MRFRGFEVSRFQGMEEDRRIKKRGTRKDQHELEKESRWTIMMLDERERETRGDLPCQTNGHDLAFNTKIKRIKSLTIDRDIT
jgi:hypothetical protein